MNKRLKLHLAAVLAIAATQTSNARDGIANRTSTLTPAAETTAAKPKGRKLPKPYWQNQHGIGITNGDGSGSYSRITAVQRGNFAKTTVKRHSKPAGGGAWQLEGSTTTLAIGNGTKIVRTDDPLLASSIAWPNGVVRKDFEKNGFTYYSMPLAEALRDDLSNLDEVANGIAKVTHSPKFVSEKLAGQPIYVSVGRPGTGTSVTLTPGMTTRQVKQSIVAARRGELGRFGKLLNQIGVALGLY